MQKKILSIGAFMAMAVIAFAKIPSGITPNRVNSTVKEVTVYQSGAKLTSVSTVNLQNGNNEIIFENLPISVNAASIQVRIKGGTSTASLSAAKFKSRYVEAASADAKLLKMMKDSITDFNDKFQLFTNERDVLQSELALIKQSVGRVGNGKEAVLSVKELQELSTFYQKRQQEINMRLFEISVADRKLREPFNDISRRFNELSQKKGKTSGEIVLSVYSQYSQSVEISCIYLVGNAKWTPQYDLRSDGIDKPLKLIYKAAVSQSCGLDWSDVKLMLSTANPNISNNRPVMPPQYIDYFVQPIAYQRREQEALKAAPNQRLEAMQRSNSYNLSQVNDDAAKPLGDEIVVENNNSNNDFTNIFEVPLLQNISTDGSEQTMTIQENELKATYEYHAVPKLELAVFLLAKVTDYGQYNLLAGNANIFYQDTYVGQSYLDPKTVSDTLLLSLGRDENLSIKRTKPLDLTSEKKIFGDTRKEVIEYEIIIKNNKRISIPIEILDQIPISRQKDIVVEVDESKLNGADYNKTYGRLLWRLNVEANSSKKLRFGYTLKYPKDKRVQLK